MGVQIKWPNDIYIGDKKIGGVLVNSSVTATGNMQEYHLTIGTRLINT